GPLRAGEETRPGRQPRRRSDLLRRPAAGRRAVAGVAPASAGRPGAGRGPRRRRLPPPGDPGAVLPRGTVVVTSFAWRLPMLTRRDFLRTSSLVALAPSVPTFLAQTARAARAERDGRALVVIQLDGGNDGINTVVPFKDPGYAKHRQSLRL